jgi:hypothetical protein
VAVLVVILIAAVVAAILWYTYQRKKKRRLALSFFARQYGLEYAQADPFDLMSYDFHLLGLGDGRGCENVMSGVWHGMPAREADYWYYEETSDGKGNRSRSYKYFSILIADVEATLPYVSISKETLFSRLADHLGFQDIAFESDDFNREFQVKSPDREFAFKLVDARMMQWLLSTDGRCGFEIRDSNMLVYARRLKPGELALLFGVTKGFQDHVPSLVWNEYGTKTERSSS